MRPVSVNSSLTNLARGNDVLYYGEFHSVSDHRRVIKDFLSEAVSNGTVDTIATEAIMADKQGVLDSYLADPLATPNSRREASIFKELRGTYVWLDSQHIKEMLRNLRQQKLSGKDIKVCAIDASTLPDYEYNSQTNQSSVNPERRREEIF